MPIDPRRPIAAAPSLASILLLVATLVPWLPSGLKALDPAARLDEVVTGAVEETFDQRLQQVAWILARADTMAPVVAEKKRGIQAA